MNHLKDQTIIVLLNNKQLIINKITAHTHMILCFGVNTKKKNIRRNNIILNTFPRLTRVFIKISNIV